MTPEKNSEALNKALEFVIANIEQGKDFLAEQGPLLVQEIVSYGRYGGLVWTCTLTVFAIACAWVCCKACARAARAECGEEGGPIAVCVVSGFALILALILLPFLADATLQAWFAPRLYVLHELKGLL